MPPAPYLGKVTAFITRSTPSGVDLLLFRHPFTGVQIPAGTVEEGETLEQAVLRETAEETGVTNAHLVHEIGWRDELPPGFTHVVLQATRVYSRPDPSSFDWAGFRRGIAVRLLREENGFAQVTYDESDRYPDPTYISYAITGWVPWSALAATNRRYFFHLEVPSSIPEVQLVSVFTDNHTFQPFWAPFDHLPEIVAPQRAWLDYVLEGLGYSFK